MSNRRWKGQRHRNNYHRPQGRKGRNGSARSNYLVSPGRTTKKKPVRRIVRTRLTTPLDTPRVSPAGVPYPFVNKDPLMGITLTNELERLVGRRLPFTHSLLWKLNQH